MFRLPVLNVRKVYPRPFQMHLPPRRPRFQFMSDLHLETLNEYQTFRIPRLAPYLVLAGDVGRLSNYEQYSSFLRRQCDLFTKVFLILGNHEFYGLSREEGIQRARSLEHEQALEGKLVVLNRNRVDLHGNERITILGCTLQSHIPPAAQAAVEHAVKDFQRIKGWTVDNHNREHDKDLEWLQQQIHSIRSEQDGSRTRIIVLTHHAPSMRETSSPKDRDSPWRSAFATDLFADGVAPILREVRLWIYGHTHYTTQFSKGTVKFLSNQRGQPLSHFKENPSWNEPWGKGLQKLLQQYRQRKTCFRVDKVISV